MAGRSSHSHIGFELKLAAIRLGKLNFNDDVLRDVSLVFLGRLMIFVEKISEFWGVEKKSNLNLDFFFLHLQSTCCHWRWRKQKKFQIDFSSLPLALNHWFNWVSPSGKYRAPHRSRRWRQRQKITCRFHIYFILSRQHWTSAHQQRLLILHQS